MFEVHQFIAARAASPEETHCLVTTLTDKQPVEVRVERAGRIIKLVAPAGALLPRDVALQTLAFKYLRSEPRSAFDAAPGDLATVSIGLCYTVKKDIIGHKLPNGRTKTRTIDPFTPDGGLKRETKASFLRYLQEKTGLRIYDEVDGNMVCVTHINVEPQAMPSETDRSRKVWFVGQAQVTVNRAAVLDAEKFNALAGRSIGNRRTYGFGAVWLSSITRQGQALEEAVSTD